MDARWQARRFRSVFALGLATMLFVSACSSSEPAPSDSGSEAPQDTFKVAMALPGPINDQGFNQAGYIGLTLIEQLGAEISYVENVDAASQIETLQNLASSGADLVIAHGGQFTDAAAEVAAQFPDVKFTVFNGEKTADNLNAYFIRYGVGSFLAGALAALTSTTGSVGFIGGAEIDNNFMLAARGIPNVDVLPIQGINVYDILRRHTLVLSKDAIDALEARFK